jgi:signal transduction histidine kinase
MDSPQKEQTGKILIIDDEEKLLIGLKAVLRRAGYQVFSANNGSQGIEFARQYLPDLVLCDVMMPPPNGMRVKHELSNDESTKDIPFIFLTARTGEADRIAGFNLGADDYVTKPFNVDELLARVQAILRRQEKGRRRGRQEIEENLDSLRSSIATNMGHELRTPLGIILATLDLAIRDRFKNQENDLDSYLATVMHSAQRLSMLVNDLILLYDIDQHKVNRFRRPLDLRFRFIEPFQRVLERYQEKELDVQIKIDNGVTVHAPDTEFAQVVSHLVDNACKFSPSGGKVSVHLAANGNGGCILTVSDEGPGIPPELREKVFERYYQISQGATRMYGGLGVGLTIARAVAEAVGGSVSIVDTEKGCTVRLIYPPVPANSGPGAIGAKFNSGSSTGK